MNSILQETADKLRAERLEMQGKIKEMKAAEDKIRALIDDGKDLPVKKTSSSRITVADKIRAVLRSYPGGVDVNDLTEAVNGRYKEDTPKSTIQSQLSRLSGDSVENIDGKWRLTFGNEPDHEPEFPTKVRERQRSGHSDLAPPPRRYDLDDEIPF